ncbi:MAG: diaminopimelate epimerase [Phycisphaerae bacterium]
MRFTKMHGLGNDYVIVDAAAERIEDPASLAHRLSDRHTGIGADGLILIHPSDHADVRMAMYNADGSRSEMCGNGLRCVVRYAVEHGQTSAPIVRVETDAGILNAECRHDGRLGDCVRVDMGPPRLDPAAIPVDLAVDRVVDHPMTIGGRDYLVTCLSMGNPHAVVFLEDLDALALESVGPRFEHDPRFPRRINAHFVRVDSPNHMTMRSWERGSGPTRACGTGACAVCVAAVLTGRGQRNLTVTCPGGDLELEWSKNDDHVHMTGPAVEVFQGDWLGP